MLGTLLLTGEARAFSLLGPFTDWMQASNYYRLPDDIGGPMDLGEEYRWNTPIVTYAFDPSFVAFFGAKGVKQVEEAIHLLNRVPAASRIVLSNYATDSEQLNVQAAEQNLIDLKSTTLGLLLEQMGLTAPIRNIYRFRVWDPAFFALYPDEVSWPAGTFPTYLIRRNFDPLTYAPTSLVNGRLYMGQVLIFPAAVLVGYHGRGRDRPHAGGSVVSEFVPCDGSDAAGLWPRPGLRTAFHRPDAR
jgi:hypothetical protein